MNKNITEFFFPRHCPICDRVLGRDEEICDDCKTIPRPVPPPHCKKCGKHVSEPGSDYCYDCLRTPRAFDRGFSLYEYVSIHDSISLFKNLGRPDYGEYYGKMMGRTFYGELTSLEADALIPIPLSEKRFRERGYNQSAILANEISQITKIPVYEDFLLRARPTKVQKHLSRSERQNNMKKAFHIPQNDVKLKTVILVDDIYTTGSTVGAAAAALKGVGINRVYFITLATGRGY